VKKSIILLRKKRPIKKLFTIKLIMIALMVIFCAGLLFPVVSPEFSGKTIISNLLSNHYSLVCHQSDQALVQLNHQHTLVCARCLGIYFGALILFVIMTIKSFRMDLGLKNSCFHNRIAIRSSGNVLHFRFN
jgi:hypothetical protein